MAAVSPALTSRYAQVALHRARALSLLVIGSTLLALFTSNASGIPLPPWIFKLNVVMLTVLVTLGVLLFTHRVPERWAHAVCAIVWMVPMVLSLSSFAATGNPKLYVLLLVELTTGIIMVSTPWIVGAYLAFDAVWVPLALHHGGPDAFFSVVMLGGTQVVAMTVHRLKLQSFAVAEQHRLEAERQIAELKISEQARADLTEQLVHAQRLDAVGTLAAGLAHDMNNVLGAIMGLADNMAETIPDDQIRADAIEILHEAERGAELTRGLLTFSRRGQYRNQVMRIGEIIDEVVALLGRTLPKTLQVEKQLVDSDACVEGDPTQFSQAVVNLGINASDAMTGKGRMIIRGETIEVAAGSPLALPAGRYARLRVIDTGMGMDEATRARAFEPFFTTKPMGKGTGLGLALVWGVVHKSRGTVAIESEVGKGTTFSIYLPLTEKKPVTPNESGALPRVAAQRGMVLVVDDEPAVRSSTSRMLERMGLRAIQASGGREALQLFEEHGNQIALVVLDMGMPEMSGAEVFRALRSKSTVKILIVTGYAMEEEVQELVAKGARVMEKPFRAQQLEVEVDRALRRSKPQATQP